MYVRANLRYISVPYKYRDIRASNIDKVADINPHIDQRFSVKHPPSVATRSRSFTRSRWLRVNIVVVVVVAVVVVVIVVHGTFTSTSVSNFFVTFEKHKFVYVTTFTLHRLLDNVYATPDNVRSLVAGSSGY